MMPVGLSRSDTPKSVRLPSNVALEVAEAISSRGGTPYIVKTGVEGARIETGMSEDPVMDIPDLYPQK